MTVVRLFASILLICFLAVTTCAQSSFSQDINSRQLSSDQNSDSNSAVQVRKAKIVTLNKITAKREIFVVNADTEIQLGSLNVKILECWKVLDPFRPDDLVRIEVYEQKKPEGRKLIFKGWMSSANPSYAVLEHYAYAIAVLECF